MAKKQQTFTQTLDEFIEEYSKQLLDHLGINALERSQSVLKAEYEKTDAEAKKFIEDPNAYYLSERTN